MSTSTEIVQYMTNGAIQVMLPDGSQCNGVIALTFTAAPGSTDLTDAMVFSVQQALVAAFPSAWSITNSDIPISKTDGTTVAYTTDYAAKTFS